MKDRTAIGAGPNITDIGSAELVGAQPGEQAGQNQRQVALGPVGAARGFVVGVHHLEQRGDRGWGRERGSVLAGLGRPTNGMGLAGISSAV